MARTAEGAALTEQHRRAQLQVRARALRDFATLWPLWQPEDDSSFPRLVEATLPLVRVYHRISASVGAAYYEAFREAEKAAGSPTPRLASGVADPQVTTSLYVTGKLTWQKARRTGQDAATARESALAGISGSLSRHVLAGGRDTIVESVRRDTSAVGWIRVTDGDPCAFCAMLAGRGPVYTQTTAEFSGRPHGLEPYQAHDHCGCSAEPVYRGADWPGRAREFHDLYNRATREAAASGELDRGTSNDLLNAFRRAYDAQRADQA